MLLTVLELLIRVELLTTLLDLLETLLAEVELMVDDEETLLGLVEVGDEVDTVELLVLGFVTKLGLVVEVFVLEVELVVTGTAVDVVVLEIVIGVEDVLRELVDSALDVDVLLDGDVSRGLEVVVLDVVEVLVGGLGKRNDM